ncbi:hypothetical protein F66182_7991 [Fusarium sp. NRRL 66182]|nr:hypothetical protein F66182_7991 [Fusarium sp. NRRL 66182]
MNPCAPTFFPTSPSEGESSDDDMRSPASKETGRPGQDLCSQGELPSIVIDPEQSPDGKEDDSEEEPEVEFLKPTVYTPRKPLELLKPTVYTPPTSSHNTQKSSDLGRHRSRPSLESRPRSKTPRPRPWRPPTPHPDGKPRGLREDEVISSDTRGVIPASWVASMTYPLNPYPYSMVSPNPAIPTPVNYAPPIQPGVPQSLMTYSPVPWTIPSPQWVAPAPQPPMMQCPAGCGGVHPYGTYPHSVYNQVTRQWHMFQPDPQLQLQLQSQPMSHGSSQKSDSRSPSRNTTVKGRNGQYGSTSSSLVVTNGSAPGTPLKTQMVPVPVGEDRELLGVLGNDSTREKIEKELRLMAEYSKAKGFIPTRQAQSSVESPSIGKSENVNLEQDDLSLVKKKSLDKGQKPDSAPHNAPTGPSYSRQVPKSSSSTAKQTLYLAGSESGAWSQSKRWTSFATKERQAFQKMMANLRYMSADHSPFVPQSPAELTAFKATVAESKTKKLDQEVQRRLAETNVKTSGSPEDNKSRPIGELLGGKKFVDCRSPVFAANNCFNKEPPVDRSLHVDWPSLSEFKEDGDKRAGRQGRCLPLPRLNIVAYRFSDEISEACNPNGSIRWEKKAVQVGSRYLCPVTQPELSVSPAIELRLEEAPFFIGIMFHEIDTFDSDADKTDNKGSKVEEKGERKVEKKE